MILQLFLNYYSQYYWGLRQGVFWTFSKVNGSHRIYQWEQEKNIFSISLQGIMKLEKVIPMNAPMDWFTQCYSPDSFNSHIGSLRGGGESDVSFPHDILLSDTNSSSQWKPNWGGGNENQFLI